MPSSTAGRALGSGICRRYGRGGNRPTEGGMRCRHYRGGGDRQGKAALDAATTLRGTFLGRRSSRVKAREPHGARYLRPLQGMRCRHCNCGEVAGCRYLSQRHHMAPFQGALAAGVAAPRSRILFGGEDCLSEASSAALTFGTGAKAPGGPRPGAHGFGSFCRNKRTSSCGDETPQALLALLSSPTPIGDPGFFFFLRS